MVKIKDIDGRDYIIEDLDRFISHLEDFHTVNGKADGSLHEENGYYFKVTQDFLDQIIDLK
ncbi:MAG TPA: hypothetical protein QF428_03125 [Flavobacteriaceae bacterium]|nr:hypothetical protein [Flavobacteriaceae bacterium]HJO70705.1 hypothetical protein [Flavobacteriaceae bacterium]